MNYLQLSGIASLLAAGVTLIAAARLLRGTGEGQAFRGVLRFTGRLMVAIGFLGGCLAFSSEWGWFAWLFVMGIWWRSAIHFRMAQKRSLLSALALAADRQMPLGPMAEAFADEGDGGFARRVRLLATRLNAGVSLADAAGAWRSVLPPESPLAIRTGSDTGDLAAALRATTFDQAFDRTLLRPVMARFLYMCPAMMFVYVFMKVKLEPSYVNIFEDFDLALPPVTLAVFGMPSPVMLNWPAWPPVVSASPFANTPMILVWIFLVWLAIFAGLAVAAWLQWRGTPLVRVPGLTRIVNWVDMGPALRVLALAAERNRPITRSLVTLSRSHPKTSVCVRLYKAVGDVNDGQPWHASLRRRRLISSADAAVLAAAERNGNLTWALREMADSFERRANFRLQALAQVVLPLILLPSGLLIGTIAIAYFLPIVELVKSLS